MKPIHLALALALAIGGFSSNAAMAQSDDWTGFYIGANLSSTAGSSDVTTSPIYSTTGYFATTSVPAIASAGDGRINLDSFSGGLSAGYNARYDNLLFGLEADFDSLDASDSRAAGSTYPCCAPTSFTIKQQTKIRNMFTFRGRMGVINNNSLFYVTAGWAQSSVKIDDTFSDTFASASESFNASKTKSGVIYGAGYEHAFASKWSFKLEYLHADFGKITGTSSNLTATSGGGGGGVTSVGGDQLKATTAYPTSVFTHTSEPQFDTFRIGFAYHF
jgi:outer membrane immunogenic protein